MMIAVGMHVEIKRSDGRIHGAVISEVKTNGRYMVEWYEKGETKGKESTLDELLKLNPTLQIHKPAPPKPLQNAFNNANNSDDEETFLLAGLKANKSIPRKPQEPVKRRPSPVEAPPPPARVPTPVLAPAPVPAPAPIRPPSPKPIPRFYPQQEVAQTNANFAFAEMIRNFRVNIDYRPLTHNDAVNENRISVCVRKRPLNKKELAKSEIDVISIPSKDITVLHQPQVRVDLTKYLDNQKFRFDYAFDESSTNELVYRFTAQPLVKTIFENGTATCFAYGQTGSGKTHTMGGDFSGKKQNASMGIYALTARDVFKTLEQPAYRRKDLSVHCAFFEIYGSKVFDLLNEKAALRVLEDQQAKVQIVGLKEELAKNEHDVLEFINKGSLVRTAGTTSANANSSRSHAVFQIILRQGKKVWGKFSLIDLAGNERGQDTRECDKEVRKEGAAINTSLLALKECIRGMARNSSHVPFRQSKLTMVLRDSFIGEKSRTVMISMISPGMGSSENTLNTLRYADRVKEMGADGSGEATPVRDEEMFMAPQSSNSDDDDADEAIQDTIAMSSSKCFNDAAKLIATMSSRPTMPKKECLEKLDQLSELIKKTREAVEKA